MKILRIFGVVVGVHVLALMLIFANPGCSSTNQPPPATETVIADGGDSPVVAVPDTDEPATSPVSADPTVSAAPFDGGETPVVRFSPTRPGTAAAEALERAPVSDVVPAKTYTVVSGDSLWTIARRNHITIAELTAANNIDRNAIVRIGQRLIIPEKTVRNTSMSAAEAAPAKPAAAPPRAARASSETVRHVVKPGETLGGIARKYHVKVGEIAMANNIADPAKIRPGMELTIPGWRKPASSTSTPAAAPEKSVVNPASPTPPVTEVPTLVIPPPEPEAEAPANTTGEEPPVIRVEGNP